LVFSNEIVVIALKSDTRLVAVMETGSIPYETGNELSVLLELKSCVLNGIRKSKRPSKAVMFKGWIRV
jgi:hypothetical protein